MTSERVVDQIQDTAALDVVVRLPVRLLRDCLPGAEMPSQVLRVLLDLAAPYAVVYRAAANEGAPLHVEAFPTKEALEAWLEERYRGIDVQVVLCAGRPVRYKMRVHARIG